MKYFLDTEFVEGTQRTFFLETKPTIDLISIGIVSEDGRSYYAISRDFNLTTAWNRWEWKEERCPIEGTFYQRVKEYWVRDNVLKPLFEELCVKSELVGEDSTEFTFSTLRWLISEHGKPNKQIAEEIFDFVNPRLEELRMELTGRLFDGPENTFNEHTLGWNRFILQHNIHLEKPPCTVEMYAQPEFYGYSSAYDWVVFCWLFGRRVSLPKGFPKNCIDLKQTFNEKQETIKKHFKGGLVSTDPKAIHCYSTVTNENKETFKHSADLKKHPQYPKKTQEHNSLADAVWTRDLFTFLNQI